MQHLLYFVQTNFIYVIKARRIRQQKRQLEATTQNHTITHEIGFMYV